MGAYDKPINLNPTDLSRFEKTRKAMESIKTVYNPKTNKLEVYFKNKKLSSNQSTEIYNSSDISDEELSPIKTSESSSSNESSKTVSNKKTEMNKYTEIGDSEFSYLTSHNYDKGLDDTEIENSMTVSQINNNDIFVKRRKK